MRKLLLVVCFLVPLPVLAQPAPTPPAPTAPAPASPADARKLCTEAMNADPMFANAIIKEANEQTAEKHMHAADAVARNEKHVILAYAAMWVVAALFVIFLWRRQQLLKTEIETLRRDLEAATKEAK